MRKEVQIELTQFLQSALRAPLETRVTLYETLEMKLEYSNTNHKTIENSNTSSNSNSSSSSSSSSRSNSSSSSSSSSSSFSGGGSGNVGGGGVLGLEAAQRLRRSLWLRLNEFILSSKDEEEEDDQDDDQDDDIDDEQVTLDLHIAKCFEKVIRPTIVTTTTKRKKNKTMKDLVMVRQRESPGGILRLLISIDRNLDQTTKKMKRLISSFTKMLLNGHHIGK